MTNYSFQACLDRLVAECIAKRAVDADLFRTARNAGANCREVVAHIWAEVAANTPKAA